MICGTRRAEQWRLAFRDAGIEAVVVEADADEDGACKVAGPAAQVVQANAIVTAVTSGQRELPGPRLSWRTILVLLVIAAVTVAMIAR